MKYAIISDIHGNLEALKGVKKDIEKEKVDKCLFLGDAVGYGADPSECIEELEKMECISIAGNHDWGAVGLTSLDNFNPYAREAVQWTREKLCKKGKEFIRSFPLVKKIHDITLVHATLQKPERWNYIFSTFQAHVNIELQETSITFVGHSHVPITFFENLDSEESVQFTRERKIEIEEGFKYIINVG
ncbi:MAG TPA: metallophosphoesterase, partial [Candidatus Omnitrophica bacterium]|nr:metallophosphoesterase [Candidatus Omnitrophota bacterium]